MCVCTCSCTCSIATFRWVIIYFKHINDTHIYWAFIFVLCPHTYEHMAKAMWVSIPCMYENQTLISSYQEKSLFSLRHSILLWFNLSVVSDSLWLHGLQHSRLPCPSLSPRVFSHSFPLSQWCHPTVSSRHPLLLLPWIFPSISVFSSESALCIRWLKHWSFSFSISPSNEYSGLISCWIDWFDVLAVQGTLRSLLQHHRYINFLKSWHLLCPLSAQKFSLSPHCLHVKI